MSVRLPDDDVTFYWPPPTSCRRGNVPNSKSASLRSGGRIPRPRRRRPRGPPSASWLVDPAGI